ncbi:hypothetical protein [Tenacibaculum agarivorans]|uniref:hypothetical protein n=1 Tax=Tenacibaculum agarivorans TaxID=1908389 RepID=UPI000A9D2C04|nr:hypothetical protein [Tenacibaculum agarivorans]
MKSFIHYSIQILLILLYLGSNAQVLDARKEFSIVLSDSTQLKVFKKAGSFDEVSDEYYSLPSHLKFSVNQKKEPEFSFLTYSDRGGSQSGILHFLMSWGLSLSQRKEVQTALEKIVGEDARFMGSIVPELDNTYNTLQIIGSSPLVDILSESATAIGRVPTFSNSKTACSFKLDHNDTETLKTAIADNTEDLKTLFLSMNFIIKFKGKHRAGIYDENYQLKTNLFELLNN